MPKLNSANFLQVTTEADLKAVTGYNHMDIAIVRTTSAWAWTGPMWYQFNQAVDASPDWIAGVSVEPWILKPDDIPSFTDGGRWVSMQQGYNQTDLPVGFGDDVHVPVGKVRLNVPTATIPTEPKIEFRGWSEGLNNTNSGWGISAGQNTGAGTANSIHVLENNVPITSWNETGTEIKNLAQLEGDADFDAHGQTDLPVGTRRPPLITVGTGGTYTFTGAAEEESVIRLDTTGIIVSFGSQTANMWVQVLNAASGNNTLSFTGTSYNLYLGGTGLISGTSDLAMTSGAVATLYFSSGTDIEITGTGVS